MARTRNEVSLSQPMDKPATLREIPSRPGYRHIKKRGRHSAGFPRFAISFAVSYRPVSIRRFMIPSPRFFGLSADLGKQAGAKAVFFCAMRRQGPAPVQPSASHESCAQKCSKTRKCSVKQGRPYSPRLRPMPMTLQGAYRNFFRQASDKEK